MSSDSKMMFVERDSYGAAIFRPFQRSGSDGFTATDAKLIGELKSTYLSATNNRTPSTAATSPDNEYKRLIITTPNADYLPEVNLGLQTITFRLDGRWGAEDWIQWPQWLFDGQEHFAYVPRKPSAADMTSHPLRYLWWNMTEEYFDETGPNAGLLRPSIAEEFCIIRRNLMREVETCRCENGADYNKLHDVATKMRSTVSSLKFTPQSFVSVMLTVTAAQRYCLTTRTILNKISKYDSIRSFSGIPAVNHDILGCVTDRIPIVYELYEKGIPVWYVRPASQLPHDMTILEHSNTTSPLRFDVVMKRWPDAPNFYQGPLSAQIHASIENWKPGTLTHSLLGATASSAQQDEPGSSTTTILMKNKFERKRFSPYPKDEATGRIIKKPGGSNICVNESLFEPPKSLYAPQPLQVWVDALKSVDRTISCVVEHPDRRLFRGFAFPPPHILCGGNAENSLDATLILYRSTGRPSFLPGAYFPR